MRRKQKSAESLQPDTDREEGERVPPPNLMKRRRDDSTDSPLPAKRRRQTQAEIQNQKRPQTRSQTRALESQGLTEHQAKPRPDSLPRKVPLSPLIEASHRVPLTRKNLARFNKMSGEGRSNTKAAIATTSGGSTLKTKTASTSMAGFADKAFANNVLNPQYSQAPTNIEDIQQRHRAPRDSASPAASDYQRYVNNVGWAPNEATTTMLTCHGPNGLLKDYNDPNYKFACNYAFSAFPQDVGFNNGLSAPQPDYVEGMTQKELFPMHVAEHVNGAVLYRDKPESLVLPHMAAEWKHGGKDLSKAELQSSYDGAALVYGRNQALSYTDHPDPPGHAEVTTFATDGWNVNFYAHYATPSTADPNTLEYHQYQYASETLRTSHQLFKDGRRGIRNLQDHARSTSLALRDDLKAHWTDQRQQATADNNDQQSNVPNEDGTMEVVEMPPQQSTPPISSQSEHRLRGQSKRQRQDSEINEESSTRRSLRNKGKQKRGRH